MRRSSFYVLATMIVAICFVGGCGGFGTKGSDKAGMAASGEGAEGASGSYVIGKGDVLEISVWREPMLSGETPVRTDGKISVALIGDIQAAGRTPMELTEEIRAGLKEFVGEPAVTVSVRTPASQRVYVVGEVRTPGEFELIKDLTVVQAIARAGGFTEWADKDSIVVLRKEDGVEKRIRVNYKRIVKGKDLGQNILLQANDTIIVP